MLCDSFTHDGYVNCSSFWNHKCSSSSASTSSCFVKKYQKLPHYHKQCQGPSFDIGKVIDVLKEALFNIGSHVNFITLAHLSYFLTTYFVCESNYNAAVAVARLYACLFVPYSNL